jgi:hypothetical protein
MEMQCTLRHINSILYLILDEPQILKYGMSKPIHSTVTSVTILCCPHFVMVLPFKV